MIILTRIGSLSVSIAMYIDTWWKIVKNQRRNEILRSVTNMKE